MLLSRELRLKLIPFLVQKEVNIVPSVNNAAIVPVLPVTSIAVSAVQYSVLNFQ